MHNLWINEIWRLSGLILLASIVGLLVNQPLVFAATTIFIYFSWHVYNVYRLHKWFIGKDLKNLPTSTGVWEELYYHIYRLQQHNRKQKKKLAFLLTRYQKSTSAMPYATVVLNENKEIEWFNKAAKQLLGLHKKKDIGQRIDNLVRHPAFSKMLFMGDFTNELQLSSPFIKNNLLSIKIVPFGKKQLLMVVRDITEIHQFELMRRDFIANISHELRTPLTVIHGYLEGLGDEASTLAVRWEQPIIQMAQQVNRMQNLIEDLLTLSKLELQNYVTQEENLSVEDIIKSITEENQLLFEQKELSIKLQISDNLGLKGSEKELRSAFLNLILNAIQYTPVSGSIEISWFRTIDGAHLSVKDSGIGIAAHHLPRITERFYRVDTGRSRDQGGTGLGLAIVKHVLTRHKARLLVTSTPGHGSTFSCAFPASRIITTTSKETSSNPH